MWMIKQLVFLTLDPGSQVQALVGIRGLPTHESSFFCMHIHPPESNMTVGKEVKLPNYPLSKQWEQTGECNPTNWLQDSGRSTLVRRTQEFKKKTAKRKKTHTILD